MRFSSMLVEAWMIAGRTEGSFAHTVQRHLHFPRFYQVQLVWLHEAARILYICVRRFPILSNQAGVTFQFEINDLSLNQWVPGRGWHGSLYAIRNISALRASTRATENSSNVYV